MSKSLKNKVKLNDMVSVKDFGAVGDGVTDDSTAFLNAFATNKRVYAPKGTYKVNLVITTSSIVLYGDGRGLTVLSPYTAANPVITLNGDLAGTIIQNFDFSDFSIIGNAYAGDGLKILNTADTHGCDRISMKRVDTSQCAYGFNCAGRSIWNYFENCAWDFNKDGVHIETDQAVNTWQLNSCYTRRNTRHGFYAYKTSIAVSGMIDFTFINLNTEYNGTDIAETVCYGLYVNGAAGWNFYGLTMENNGTSLTSGNSYGAMFTGPLNRGISIDGVWFVNSKYGIVFNGQKASGLINNVYQNGPLVGGIGIWIASSWFTNEPKIKLGNVLGNVQVDVDGNGNYPTTDGFDWQASAIAGNDYSNSKNRTVNTTGGAPTLSGVTITGTAGQFSCTASTLVLGQQVTISGVFGGTGSITGYANPTTYYIVATNGTTTFTLSTTPTGSGVTTTAGTPTGLTYTLPITVSTISGLVAGDEVCFFNYSIGATLSVNALLMADGATAVIQPMKSQRLKVMGYPRAGLLTAI